MIGQRDRVYEVLNRKRKLTLAMVWRLHSGLGIPAESLIRQPGSEDSVLLRQYYHRKIISTTRTARRFVGIQKTFIRTAAQQCGNFGIAQHLVEPVAA